MLRIGTVVHRNCQGVSRRELLQVGGSSLLGLTLAGAFRADASPTKIRPSRREISCILIYLAGGPSHLETFDPKPDAPLRIRGPWGVIPTRVPGTRLSELLPMLAQQTDRFALIRSLHHAQSLHLPVPMMTGNVQQTTTYGAACTFLKKHRSGDMPPYVHVGSRLSVAGGSLGPAFNPFEIRDPLEVNASLADFNLAADVPPERLEHRKELLSDIDSLRRLIDTGDAVRSQDSLYRRAFSVLTSTRVREAFDLSREPEALRDRYGANSFGQSCVMARRLIEAGTRFVQVMWYDREDGFAVGWDVHGDDFNGLVRMEQQLCPRLDQGLSALLDDLHQRGLLATTLVVVTGEFGRTPRITRHGGRDHWPYCFSALLAGAGVPGGAVVGASDSQGAYPLAHPVSAADFAATLYRILGVDVNQDDRLRPAVFEGRALDELCVG